MIKVQFNTKLNEISSSKSLFVFDFDDTIAISDSKVFLVRNNERIEMDSARFADYQYQDGDEMDFSDFNRVDAEIIPNTLAILDAEMSKGHKIVIVTARPPGAVEGIKTFFRQNGMTPPDIYATSGSANKPAVLKNLLEQGNYGRVIVYEDCRKNIESLKPVADEMGIPYTAICVEKNAQMRKMYENKEKTTRIKVKINKTLQEYSKEEKKFFGDGIAAVIDNPDKLYYTKEIKSLNPFDPDEEKQFLNRHWIEENVGRRMGGGSFRDAYHIKGHPDKIFKISNRYIQNEPMDGQEHSTVAEDTNALEIDLFNQYPDYFPRVFLHDQEKQGIPRWLIIEKAKVIEWDYDFIRQLNLSFKSIPKSYKLINELIAQYFPSTSADFPPASGTGREIDEEQWAYVAWQAVGFNQPEKLKNVLKDLPVWDEIYGDVLQHSIDRVDDEEILLDEAVAASWNILTRDQNLIKFWDMVNDLHIEYNELRPGNVGTDIQTGTKFLIIDISIFED